MNHDSGSPIKVLLDTNLVIKREDNREVEKHIGDLLHHFQTHNVNTVIHPSSVDELRKDRNKVRKVYTLSKVRTYDALQNPPIPDNDFIEIVYKAKNSHDVVDSYLLYCVLQNVVDFLITEDKKIRKLSELLGCSDRVMGPIEALEYFDDYFRTQVPITPTYIRNEKVYSIVNLLRSGFFESFREEYPGFDEWFKTKARDRDCYYVSENGQISAIMILKTENGPIELSEKTIANEKRLKICSLKIDEKYSGNKVVEKLLQIAFQIGVKEGYSSVYLTVYPKYQNLISKITNFGFFQIGLLKNSSELFFEKRFKPIENVLQSPFEYVKSYYPNYRDDASINKFIVPMRPEYHRRLFPEYMSGQMDLYQYFAKIPVGNAIMKTYVSNSNSNKIKKGDLIFFYRSRKQSGITSLCVVEDVLRTKDFEKLNDFVSNRTVYSREELKNMTCDRTVIAIRLWQLEYYNLFPTSNMKAKKFTIPQSISSIPEEKYQILRRVLTKYEITRPFN